MKTNSKRVSIIGLALAFIVSLFLAVFVAFGAPVSSEVMASAATNAKITGVTMHGSGTVVYLMTDIPTSVTPTNYNHSAYLPKWRYQNITMNGIQAVEGGMWDNGGYFEADSSGYWKYTMGITTSDIETIEVSPNGYKYVNFKVAKGGNIGNEYTLGSDFEFTLAFNSNNTLASVAKTARITHVVNHSTDNSYFWYQFYTNILGSETATNKDHNTYMTPWRTTSMLVNGSAVVANGDFYYAGGFRNDASRAFRNTDGTQATLYYVWMTGIPKASVNKLSDKKITIQFLPGRRLGNEYIFGYEEEIVIDYSSGSSAHSLPIKNTSIVSHAENTSNGTYEVFVNLPGVTDFKNSALIAPIRSAIKVDGKELSDAEKNMTYFSNGKFKISGKTDSTGAFSAGTIHEVVIPAGTKFEAEYYVNTSSGAGFVEGYTNRTLAEEIRFYVYQSANGTFQVTENQADIEVDAEPAFNDPYLDLYADVDSISYTEGAGWKVTSSAESTDSNCYRFLLKKSATAAAIADGMDKLTITFGGSFDGTAHAGNPVNCNIWFLLPKAGNGNMDWLHGSYISQLKSVGGGKYAYTIDLTNTTYDFVNYDIVIRVSNNDVAAKSVHATYIHNIEYTETYTFDANAITMLDGASVRMKNPTGIGFTTRIDKEAYDEAVAKCGAENVVVGTIILPTDYLTCDFTFEALDENDIMYKDIANMNGWKNEKTIEKDGYYEFRGSIAPVQEYNYTRNFSARGYIGCIIDGQMYYTYTTYSEEQNSRNVAYIAQAAYEDVYTPPATMEKDGSWMTVRSNCTTEYTEGKGWKATSTSGGNYELALSASVLKFYKDNGYTSVKLVFGKAFDGASIAGNPVNCQIYISAYNGSGWSNFHAGWLSGLTSEGDGKYSITIDITNEAYTFAADGVKIYMGATDVNGKQVGMLYIHDVIFGGVAEKDITKYPYEVMGTLRSPYTAEERKILEQFITFDSVVSSSYKIVRPSSATDSETTAANLMKQYLQEALGVTCEVISDANATNLTSASKYISIGQTRLLEDAKLGTSAEENVSGDGYIIKTMGCVLFIDGIIDRGTIYGVMDFAEEYLGYVFIDGECYTVNAVDGLDIQDVEDKAFTPYVETRSYLEYDVTQGYTDPVTAISRKSNNYYVKNVSAYGGANDFGYWGDNAAHTMQATLEKGIELDGGTKKLADYAYRYTVNSTTHYQPCLTNETTKALMANAMKELIKAKYASGIRYYTLTQEDSSDNNGYCTCSSCKSARTTYGGQSGVTLKFLNDIIAILDGDTAFATQYPDYKLYTYAYNYSFAYPTVSNTVIKACDKVAVMLCPSATDARYDLLNTTYNKESATALNGWHNYCADLMIWMYDANFTDYVEYHPTLSGVIADNVYKLRKLGVSYVMINGAYNADGMWDDKIRAYVYSELLYNFNETKYKAGADAYVNELVAEYLAAYYGEYADEVQGIITAFQAELTAASLAGNKSNASKMDIGTIQDKISVMEAAINANSDATMEKRLYAVKASLLATLYENAKPVFASMWSYKSEFKTACNNAGITMWSETQTVTDKFGS